MKKSVFPVDDHAQVDVSNRSVQRFASFVPAPGAAGTRITAQRARTDRIAKVEAGFMIALLDGGHSVTGRSHQSCGSRRWRPHRVTRHPAVRGVLSARSFATFSSFVVPTRVEDRILRTVPTCCAVAAVHEPEDLRTRPQGGIHSARSRVADSEEKNDEH